MPIAIYGHATDGQSPHRPIGPLHEWQPPQGASPIWVGIATQGLCEWQSPHEDHSSLHCHQKCLLGPPHSRPTTSPWVRARVRGAITLTLYGSPNPISNRVAHEKQAYHPSTDLNLP